jgi:uncharacterized membrane-anchored protein
VRTGVIILAVLAQIAALAWIGVQRELILATGEIVYLRTAPVDPRDLFRGDYVELNYEVNWVDGARWRGATGEAVHVGQKLYAALGRDPGGLGFVESLSDRPPADGAYIAGRAVYGFSPASAVGGIQVKYGVERYFVQQGRGLEIEKRRGGRDDLQVPMEIEIAFGGDGTAAIKGYRWSRIGMRLDVVRAPVRQRPDGTTVEPTGPLSPKLRVTLTNVSDTDFAVADPGPHCGFRLMAAERMAHQDYEAVDRGCDRLSATAADVRLLRPEESYSAEIDLSEPAWHVTAGGRTDEVGKLAQWDRFRLVYRSPAPELLAQTPMADRLWLGHLPSRAFNGAGLLD